MTETGFVIVLLIIFFVVLYKAEKSKNRRWLYHDGIFDIPRARAVMERDLRKLQSSWPWEKRDVFAEILREFADSVMASTEKYLMK